ncbi:cupin-like domain-containing protein [Brevundimonas sp.]|uniref:cupin-like domain-containing protein n=1 Tax=Brevundimonas sp. TaxID=1871086 RepID=UPI0035B332F1
MWWDELERLPEARGVDRARFEAEIKPAAEPVVMRGLVSDWPAIAAARDGTEALAGHLKVRSREQPLDVWIAEAGLNGRFFYGEGLTGLNHRRERSTVGGLLERLVRDETSAAPEAVYAGGVPLDRHLPELLGEVPMPLLAPETERLTSLWLGNRVRTAAHWDLAQNLAGVIAGRRRFILFPPESIGDLYVGPIDVTLAGQPTSLVDFHAPDFEAFPRFREAMKAARVAELGPADVIYIPSLWFHHVETLSPVGAMVNFWWRDGPAWMKTPQLTLMHALLTMRDLPPPEKRAWRAFFDHYIFGEDAVDHIPEAARGVLGPMTSERRQSLSAVLARSLAR